MNNYTVEDDLSIAMLTTEITPEFLFELERVRIDLGVSPYVSFTDDMIKWFMIALNRADKTKDVK